MSKSNKCNIQEDEQLAIEVQKHSCLYDKTEGKMHGGKWMKNLGSRFDALRKR